ncbi:MAG TPA: APC family permease [Terriglobales bacterium]|nr:APC family permease [Terriglobales bacterium]
MASSHSTTAVTVQRAKSHLLRILGVGFGVAVIVGSTIGSGILRTPGEIAAQLGSKDWIIGLWLLGGLYAFFCTLSVVELGTSLPFAGGWYVFSRRAFGEYVSFAVGSSDWMMQMVASAYLAVAFGEFAAQLQPALQGYVKLLAAATLIVLGLLNWLGLRCGSRAQELTSALKALGLIAFVVGCWLLSPGHASLAAAPLHAPGPKRGLLLAMVIAWQAVIVTYDGWYSAIYFTEEDTDPRRNLPRSSISGVLACIAIFVLVNVALLRVLPMGQLAASETPMADAAMATFGNHGRQFILIIALITAVSTINANLLIAPRILFGMARDGLMPAWATRVNSGGTPASALLVGMLAAIGLVLSGSFETLIAIASFLFVAVYLSGFAALFVLRVREPNLPRPFRMWGYPWSNLAVLLASAAFLVATVVADLKDALFTLVFVALTCPIYLLIRNKPAAAAMPVALEK